MKAKQLDEIYSIDLGERDTEDLFIPMPERNETEDDVVEDPPLRLPHGICPDTDWTNKFKFSKRKEGGDSEKR